MKNQGISIFNTFHFEGARKDEDALDDLLGREGPLDDSPTCLLSHCQIQHKSRLCGVKVEWRKRASFSFSTAFNLNNGG